MSHIFRTPSKKDGAWRLNSDKENEPKEEATEKRNTRADATAAAAGADRPAIGTPSVPPSSAFSSTARRKLEEYNAAQAHAAIELQAAEEAYEAQKKLSEKKAELQKQLVAKKLEFDLAQLDAELEDTRLSYRSSIPAVNDWLEKCDGARDNTPLPSSPPARNANLRSAQAAPPPPPLPQPPIPPLTTRDDYAAERNTRDHYGMQNRVLLTRLATSKDLPVFYGDPMEWLQFKAAFYESTRLCNYSDTENVWRLRKCLRSDAKEAVSSLLIGTTTPHAILDTLELRFGRPEAIMCKILSQLRKLPPLPPAYHTEIVVFSIKIKNFVAAIQAINQPDYLRSPELVTTIVSKLPSTLITKWADYAHDHRDDDTAKLQLLSEFLYAEATKSASSGVSYINSTSEVKRRPEFIKAQHPQRYNVLLCSDTQTHKEKCQFCRGAIHALKDCSKFKRAMRRDRWRFARTKNLCYKCLGARHADISTCSAPACDIDGCGRPHHRLLHWQQKQSSEAAGARPDGEYSAAAPDETIAHAAPAETDTVAHAAAPGAAAPDDSSACTVPTQVLLKIVPVTINGPKGVIHTHALLDDGATVSLISANLADKVGLKGKTVRMRARSAWDSGELVCETQILNFAIKNSNGECFDMCARKIDNLNLPVQRFQFDNSTNLFNYAQLNLCNCNAKPELLIGQDNCDLIVPIICVKGEPYVTKTKLGWCVHGNVAKGNDLRSADPFVALSALHGSHYESAAPPLPSSAPADPVSTPADPARTPADPTRTSANPVSNTSSLHEFVRKSFELDSIGICNKPRQNQDEVRAIPILNKTSEFIDGQWYVNLPWKRDDFTMPDSYPTALTRLKAIMRKMASNPPYASRYQERIDHLFNNNYAREINPGEQSDYVWYFKPMSESLKSNDDCASSLSTKLPRSADSTMSASETALDAGSATSASETALELHVFCDASPSAYAAVAYWRKVTNDGNVLVAFAASKCRVAPTKPVTIPRLELQGALLACRLSESIKNEHRLIPTATYYWTDSTTVLHWIRNECRTYNIFIANRLGEIDEKSKIQEWHYVPTDMNVADLATKMNDYELKNECEWFRGPSFLHADRNRWPLEPETKRKISDEILEKICTTYEKTDSDLPVPEPTRFSSWLKLLRTTAMVLLFIERCRNRNKCELTLDLMKKAEILLLRHSQAQSFASEIDLLKENKELKRDSRLRTLTPYISPDGLLLVDGRIHAAKDVPEEVRAPIILDGRNHTTRLIVKDYHIRAAHANNETVVNELRLKYWVLRLRPTVRTVASQCMLCRIKKATPKPPRMGDLPEGRLAHHQRPFTICGIDLFGPMEVTIGRQRPKRYGVLFTCMTVRAIHLEIVPSLTTDSLIMALRRMAARRGWPHQICSDNGTNLRGASAELKRAYGELDQETLASEALNKGVNWSFIPPGSPHMGGAWERLIRSVKTTLKVVLKEKAPREETLATLMCEVEAIVNSRPLTYVPVGSNDEIALTPNHFLLGTSSNLPIPGTFNDGDLYLRKQWRIAQRLADLFWCRWMKEVLPTLIPRQKWQREGLQLKVGDVVLIIDPSTPRGYWPKGVITAVQPGTDGRVRVVDIRTKTGVMRRPAARVARIVDGSECCQSNTGVEDVDDADGSA